MRPRLQRVIASATIGLSGLLAILLLGCFPQLASEKHRGQILCREEVPVARRDELARKLQIITGWRDLNFDQHGRLLVGSDTADNGSISARSLIAKTLSGDKVLILEDASNRADVVFARVVPGRWKNNAGENPPAFVVMIDFADFDRLMGDRPALQAFNVGWGVLHEIDHVANDSVDSEVLGHIGECESHINKMRRECHLPERLDYLFTLFPNIDQSDFRTRFVRLAFDQDDPSAKKHRRFWVIWDAAQVGGLDSSKQIAQLR